MKLEICEKMLMKMVLLLVSVALFVWIAMAEFDLLYQVMTTATVILEVVTGDFF